MSEGPGFLEFFILEASDYVEQLDGLLLGGNSNGPDPDAMQRVARALRGTATMAKLPSFAGVAAGVERVGRAMQQGVLRWDPALGGAVTAAVDDLKTLIHAARKWSPAEDDRAKKRSDELGKFFGQPVAASEPPTQKAAAAGSAFLSSEASNIAAGLELLNTRAGAADTAANLLRRVRALRGVAGVKEVTPLADVLESAEDAARGLELGDTSLTPEARHLFDASANYLREIATSLRFEGADVGAPSPARDAFLAAQDRWSTRAGQGEQVVPITSLFYVDGGPGVVEAAENPPTSAAARFRLELVSHGEHLRQVVDAAHRAHDGTSADRVRRDLRRALRALEATSDSFGEGGVSEAIRAQTSSAEALDAVSLDALDRLATVLSRPSDNSAQLIAELYATTAKPDSEHQQRVERVEEPVAEHVDEPHVEEAPVADAKVDEPIVEEQHAEKLAEKHLTPVVSMIASAAETVKSAAATLIDSGLAALEELTSERWLPAVAIPEEEVVPIETLLYRGRAALDRAAEIRDEARRSGSRIDDETLNELFDLVELARTE